jgi:hypothetical protein
MSFFVKFPSTIYSLTDENGVTRSKAMTNLMIRVIFQKIVETLNVPYVYYDVNDGERPDTVATKYYGSAQYTWVVLLANEIYHHNDWPKGEHEFQEYLTAVYGSIAGAQAAVHGYQNADGHWIDETTYNSLSSTARTLVSEYDREVELNDERRRIKLIPKTEIPTILRQIDDALQVERPF